MLCSICGRVSSRGDHADCTELHRIHAEDETVVGTSERINLQDVEIAKELRALLDYMSATKD